MSLQGFRGAIICCPAGCRLRNTIGQTKTDLSTHIIKVIKKTVHEHNQKSAMCSFGIILRPVYVQYSLWASTEAQQGHIVVYEKTQCSDNEFILQI